MSLFKHDEIEFRTYGLYSDVAKSVGTTSANVDAVYSWYLKDTLRQLVEQPTKQAFMRGLGIMKINPTLGVLSIGRGVHGLKNSLNEYLDKGIIVGIDDSSVSLYYLRQRVQQLQTGADSLQERMDSIRNTNILTELSYINLTTRLEKLKTELNQLYESIQRIPEDQQKRTSERGQDFTWTDEQGSKPF